MLQMGLQVEACIIRGYVRLYRADVHNLTPNCIQLQGSLSDIIVRTSRCTFAHLCCPHQREVHTFKFSLDY